MSRDREAAIAARLALRYQPSDGWVLVRHPRSALGGRAQAEGVRIADVAAINTWTAQVEVIEIKETAEDFREELEQPEKAAPFAPHAWARWFAVPAPYTNVVPSPSLVPHPWGLLSVGTGAPVPIVEAVQVEPKERLSTFTLALLRAMQVGEAKGSAADAPLVDVVRPFLGGGHVGLACFHVAMHLEKRSPLKLPCTGCRDGRPTDREAIEAAIRDATRDDLDGYAALIEAQRGRVA
jgi:hypothetical protein